MLLLSIVQTMKQSRRDVLRTGAGLASAGLLSGLAGCGVLPSSGGLLGGGNAYRGWLAAPDEVGLGDNYSIFSTAPSTLANSEEFSDEDEFDSLESGVENSFAAVDIDFEDIETTVSLGNDIQVATGSFTVEDLVEELEDNDYDEESELDSGERVFVNDSGSQGVTVSSDYVVTMSRASLEAPPSDAEPSNPDVRSISYDQTITSRIDDSDPSTYTHNGYHDPITFQGNEGDVVTIEMVSEDDTYLQLENPSGTVVTANDDFNGLDSRIDSYTLEESGEYTIIATSFSSYDTFTYRLRLTNGSGADELVRRAETYLGVQTGDTANYTDESDVVSDLVSALGGGDLVSASVYEQEEGDDPENGRIEDSVANGLALTVDGSVFNVTGAVVFDSESDADAGDVEDWADDGTTFANGNLDDVSASENGRVVTVSATVDVDDLS